MSFKTKNRKKSQFDTRVTLDAKYNDKVKYFSDKQESLSEKLNKLEYEVLYCVNSRKHL